MTQLSKLEIKEKVSNAFRYFAGQLYDVEVYKHKPKSDTFTEQAKRVFPPDADLSALRTFSADDIRTTPGMGIWDASPGRIAVLLSPAFLSLLPGDFEVDCILSGDKKKVSELDAGDMDTRFGMTAYGFYAGGAVSSENEQQS